MVLLVTPYLLRPFNIIKTFGLKKTVGVLLAIALGGCTAPVKLTQAPGSRFIQTKPDVQPVIDKPTQSQARMPAKDKVVKAEPARKFPEPSILNDLTADKVTSLLGVNEHLKLTHLWRLKLTHPR